MANRAADLVAEARPSSERLTVDQTAAALARGEAVLIDLRVPGERVRPGAIPGAVRAPWGNIEFWEELTSAYCRMKVDPRGRVILHCSSGGSSARVADVLHRMGYTNVAYLVGGFSAWLAAGQPVDRVPMSLGHEEDLGNRLVIDGLTDLVRAVSRRDSMGLVGGSVATGLRAAPGAAR